MRRRALTKLKRIATFILAVSIVSTTVRADLWAYAAKAAETSADGESVSGEAGEASADGESVSGEAGEASADDESVSGEAGEASADGESVSGEAGEASADDESVSSELLEPVSLDMSGINQISPASLSASASQAGIAPLSDDAPELNLTIGTFEGAQQTGGSENNNRSLVFSKTDRPTVIVDAHLGASTGVVQNSYYQIMTPYAILDGDGGMDFTYDGAAISGLSENQWFGLAVKVESAPDGTQVRVGAQGTWENLDPEKGYMGDVYFRLGNITPTMPGSMRLSFSTVGQPQESTIFPLRFGCGYGSYIKDGAEAAGAWYHDAGTTDRYDYSLLYSNINWSFEIEPLTNPKVLWSQYNYMTYLLTITNDSETPEAVVNDYELNFRMEHEAFNNGEGGLRNADSLRWVWENGTVRPATEEEQEGSLSNNIQYIGKKWDGGILVYNVSDYSEEDQASWDPEDPTTLPEELKELPFELIGGREMIIKAASLVGLEGGLDSAAIKPGEKQQFYVMLPFANNYVQSRLRIDSTHSATITCGEQGEGGRALKWSLTDIKRVDRELISHSTSLSKYVTDEKGERKDTIEIGYNVNTPYYIGDIVNHSNIPIFSPEVVDTLPDSYQPTEIYAYIDEDKGWEDVFATQGVNFLGLEFQREATDPQGGTKTERKIEYLGTLEEITSQDKPDIPSGKKAWRVTVDPEEFQRLKAGSGGWVFTGNMVFKLKEKMACQETLPVTFEIAGNFASFTKEEYLNQARLAYETHIWNSSPTEVEDKDIITQYPGTPSSATVYTRPGLPMVQAYGIRYNEDSQTVEKSAENGRLSVPNEDMNTGYEFVLGNNSDKTILPGIVTVTPGAASSRLRLERLEISQALSSVADITKMIVYYKTSQGGTEQSLEAESPSGTISLKELIEAHSGAKNYYITKIEMKVASFRQSVSYDDGAYFRLYGPMLNQGVEVPVTTTWNTDYEDPSKNQTSTATAKLYVEPPVPVVKAAGIYQRDDGSLDVQLPGNKTKPNTVTPLTVPHMDPKAGYQFILGNTHERTLMSPALLEIRDVGSAMSWNTIEISPAFTGDVEPEKVVISYEKRVETTVGGQQTTEYVPEELEISGSHFKDNGYKLTAQDANFPQEETRNISIKLYIASFPAGVNPETDTDYWVRLYGSVSKKGQTLPLYGYWGTAYPNGSGVTNITKNDWGSLYTMSINPFAEARAVYTSERGDSVENIDTSKDSVTSAAAPWKEKNLRYEFLLGNDSATAMGASNVDIKIDWSTNPLMPLGQQNFGFSPEKMLVSGNYDSTGIIKEILIFDAPSTTYEKDTATKIISKGELDAAPEEGGNKVIDISDLSHVANVRIAYENFYGEITGDNVLKVQLTEGVHSRYGLNKGTVTFTSLDASGVAPTAATASFDVQKPSPTSQITVYNPETGTKVNSASVLQGEADLYYDVLFGNNSISHAYETRLDIDLEANIQRIDSIGGFGVSEIRFDASFEEKGALSAIELYEAEGYDADALKNGQLSPAAIITPEQLKTAPVTGTGQERMYVLSKEGYFNDLTELRLIRIIFEDFTHDITGEKRLHVQVAGETTWFGRIPAASKALVLGRQSEAVAEVVSRAFYDVSAPEMRVTTHVEYYDLNERNLTYTGANPYSTHWDQNKTALGVPYAREFAFRTNVGNEKDISLDDSDLRITLPSLQDEDGDRVGFHPDRVEIPREFLDHYQNLQAGDQATVTLTDAEGNEAVLTFNKALRSLSGGSVAVAATEGRFTITKEQIADLGLGELKYIDFHGYDFASTKDTDGFDIYVYGFEDKPLNASDDYQADTANYLLRVREEANKVSAMDASRVVVSKMYYDTILASTYKDREWEKDSKGNLSLDEDGNPIQKEDTKKVDAEGDPQENVFSHRPHVGAGETWNSELELGNKAIGSYALDFRQYLKAGTNAPLGACTGSCGHQGQEQYSMAWIYTQSYNTAATVELTVDLPADKFDAYYIKLDPRIKEWVNSVTVTPSVGDAYTVYKKGQDSWQENAIETDQDGVSFFRINLLGGEANRYSENQQYYYRHPDVYGETPQDTPAGGARISQVVFHLSINQEAASVENGSEAAKNPDYGTWYDEKDENSKYMMEITGRFVTEITANASGNSVLSQHALATANTKLTIGGGANGAKERVLDSATEEGYRNQKSWSWKDYFTCVHTNVRPNPVYRNEYKAGHLRSTNAVQIVLMNSERALKGVVDSTSLKSKGDVPYGGLESYVVSFYREPASYTKYFHSGSLQSGESGGYSAAVNVLDFTGKYSFADRVRLTDTLPQVYKDSRGACKGFLTQKVILKPELMENVFRADFHIQQRGSDGALREDVEKRTVSFTKEQLTGAVNAYTGEALVVVQYPGETETGLVIALAENEYITSCDIQLNNLWGDMDHSKELDGVLPDFHETKDHIDMEIEGNVYAIDTDPATVKTNTVKPEMITPDTERLILAGTANTAVLYNDKMLIAGSTELTVQNIEERSPVKWYSYPAADGPYAGYAAPVWLDDMTTVNTHTYEARLKNSGSSDQYVGLDAFEAVMTISPYLNVDSILLPKEVVEGGFRPVKLTLKVKDDSEANTVEIDFTDLEALKNQGLLSQGEDAEGNPVYRFDVEEWFRKNPDYLTKYVWTAYGNVQGAKSMDPDDPNLADPYYPAVKAHVNSFVLRFEAESISHQLQRGTYLTPDGTQAGYTFRYTGNLADRTMEEFSRDVWTADSYPSLNMALYQNNATMTGNNSTSGGYNVRTTITNTISGSVETEELNVQNQKVNATGKSVNTAGMLRQTGVGIGSAIRRYDLDEYYRDSLDSVSQYDAIVEGTRLELTGKNAAGLSGDYVDYDLILTTLADSQRVNGLFTYNEGMRNGFDFFVTLNGAWASTGIQQSVFEDAPNLRLLQWKPDPNVPREWQTAYLIDENGNETRWEPDTRMDSDSSWRIIRIHVEDPDKGPGEVIFDKTGAAEWMRITVTAQLMDQEQDTAIQSKTSHPIYGYLMPSMLHHVPTVYNSFYVSSYPAGYNSYSTLHKNSYVQWKDEYRSQIGKGKVTDAATLQSFVPSNPVGTRLSITFKKDSDADNNYNIATNYNMSGTPGVLTVNETTPSMWHSMDSLVYEADFKAKNGNRVFSLTQMPVIDTPERRASWEEQMPDYDFDQVQVKIEYLFDAAYSLGGQLGTDPGWQTYTPGTDMSQEDLAHIAKLRWTYTQLPGRYNNATSPPFGLNVGTVELQGVSIYTDARSLNAEGKPTAAMDTYWAGQVSITKRQRHVHEEDMPADSPLVSVSTETASVTINVYPERPVLQVQTQIFETEEEAAAPHDPDARQKAGYRPGDTMYHKIRVENSRTVVNNAAYGGRFWNPEIYDVFTEYYAVVPKKEDITVSWFDGEGNPKTLRDEDWSVTKVDEGTMPDYGGATTLAQNSAFLPDGNNSHETAYTVWMYQFQIEMLPGDYLELYYETQVRRENLPMVYREQKDGDVIPDYMTDMSRYNYGTANTVSKSITTTTGKVLSGNWWNNANRLLNLDYLFHDVGVSGTRNEHWDKWQFLDGSWSYIPGNNTVNGSLQDGDTTGDTLTGASINQGQRVQRRAIRSGTAFGELPGEARYGTGSSNNTDFYRLLTKLRIDAIESGDYFNESVREREPILWTEARSHLQKAWLFGSSRIAGNTGDFQADLQFDETDATLYDYRNYTVNTNSYYAGASTQVNHIRSLDFARAAIEKNQNIDLILEADNYGDWDLDGVVFTYTLPRGISPRKGGNGGYLVTAEALASLDTASATLTESWRTLDASLIEVEALQSPGNYAGYQSVTGVQNPVENKGLIDDVGANYYEDNDENRPWVLKITVKEPLRKWMGHSENYGYKLRVTILSLVEEVTADEQYFDQLVTEPYCAPGSGNHLFYQIYDMEASGSPRTHQALRNGNNVWYVAYQTYDMDASNAPVPKTFDQGGMDKVYGSAGKPATPHAYGHALLNYEVNTGLARPVRTVEYYSAGSNTDHKGLTGTEAVLRKPVIRTYLTVGENVPAARQDYYVNGNIQVTKVQLHAENNYYRGAYTYYTHSNTNSNNAVTNAWAVRDRDYDQAASSVAVIGGSKGNWQEPVISALFSPQMVPLDEAGWPVDYPQSSGIPAYEVYDLEGTRLTGKALKEFEDAYTIEVKKLSWDKTQGGQAGDKEERYLITFRSSTGKIAHGEGYVFHFNLLKKGGGDDHTMDGTQEDLLKSLQQMYAFGSSTMGDFRYLIEQSSGNVGPTGVESRWAVGMPYTGPYTLYQNGVPKPNKYYDQRPDSEATSNVQTVPGQGGNIPLFRMNSAVDTNKKIMEQMKPVEDLNAFNVEEYSDIREELLLPEDIFTEATVYSTTKMFVGKPILSVDARLSSEASERGAGKGEALEVNDSDGLTYSDQLWYSARVENKPLNSTDDSQGSDLVTSRFSISFHLPKLVEYEENAWQDSWYLEFHDGRQAADQVSRMSQKEMKDAGWSIRLKAYDKEKNVLTFEITTPKSRGLTDFSSFLNGETLPGYFAQGSYLDFKIRTRVLHEPETVKEDSALWEGMGEGQVYVTVHDPEGGYIFDSQDPDSVPGFAGLEEYLGLWGGYLTYTDPVEDGADHDYDLDGILETYASDSTGTVKVRKVESAVRIDTELLRRRTNDEQAAQIFATDAYVKSNQLTTILVDQASLSGGSVKEFIADVRLPYTGSLKTTYLPGTESGLPIRTLVETLKTGHWELSGSSQEEKAELLKRLRVYVYALLVEDVENSFNLYASVQDAETQWADHAPAGASWKLLNPNGTLLDGNIEIPVAEDDQEKIKQIRYVVRAGVLTQEDRAKGLSQEELMRYYPVPDGLRLSLDADSAKEGSQDMNQWDPDHANIYERNAGVDQASAGFTVRLEPYSAKVGDSSYANNRVVHANFFAESILGYDWSQHAVFGAGKGVNGSGANGGAVLEGNPSRTGLHINPELPFLKIDVVPYYFFEKDVESYAWTTQALTINPMKSTVMKYRVMLTNMTRNMAAEDLKGGARHVRTNVLAFGIARGNVPLSQGDLILEMIREDVATNPALSLALPVTERLDEYRYDRLDAVMEYPDSRLHDSYSAMANMDYDNSQWTWYVNKVDENDQGLKSNVRLDSHSIYRNVIDTTGYNRKVVNWQFANKLAPGDQLVVETTVPLNSLTGAVSPSLLELKAFVTKHGNFEPWTYGASSASGSSTYEIDSADVNKNGLTQEMLLSQSVDQLSYTSVDSLGLRKSASTEVESDATDTMPAAVPEGGKYSFKNQLTSLGNVNYQTPVFYDILPHVGDLEIVNGDRQTDGSYSPRERGSKWSGWLDLESVEVARRRDMTEGENVLRKDVDYELWIGPFTGTGASIEAVKDDPYPTFLERREASFYLTGADALYQSSANKRAQNLIPYSELLALKSTDPARYQRLEKEIRVLWVELLGDQSALNLKETLEINYDMRTPLNLPKLTGTTSDVNTAAPYVSWNTFAADVEGRNPLESNRAGVYVNAPTGKGYIGSYVWSDIDFNAQMDDAVYAEAENGRMLYAGPSKDINGDGIVDAQDDPGIDGVKVELLTAKGYPANKNGEAVAWDAAFGQYRLIDETTGKFADGGMGAGGTLNKQEPYVVYTQQDVANRHGYYILSNLTPGQYKLRFTMPEEYASLKLTTWEIGEEGIPMSAYNAGDSLPITGVADPSSGRTVGEGEQVFVTDEAITVNAVELEGAAHKAYDQRMTSYSIGVSRAIRYGGFAFPDKDMDGIWNNRTGGLANVKITLFDADTGRIALDADGKEAVTLTDWDASGNRASSGERGYFYFMLPPGRRYYFEAEHPEANMISTPVVPSNNVLEAKWYSDIRHQNGVDRSGVFTTGYTLNGVAVPLSKDGKYYDTIAAGGTGHVLGAGFADPTPNGLGSIGSTIFEDADYSGVLDENEKGIAKIRVEAVPYYYDEVAGDWVPTGEAPKSALTDTNGNYLVRDLETSYLKDGEEYLRGYLPRVVETTIPAGYVVTRYEAAKEGIISHLDRTDFSLAKDMIVVARAKDTAQDPDAPDAGTMVERYDLKQAVVYLEANGGLLKPQTGTIKGRIWEDDDYDGILEKGEKGVSGVKVILHEGYLDENGDYQEQKANQTVTVAADGAYEFNALPVSVKDAGGASRLAAYRIEIQSLPTGSLATRWNQGEAEKSSWLLVKDDGTWQLYEDGQYELLARAWNAEDDASTDPSFKLEAKGEGYNLLLADKEKVRNGGIKQVRDAVIEGVVFLDKNIDGYYNPGREETVAGVTLTLTRYIWEDGAWVADDAYNQTPVSTVTDASGSYRFDSLPFYQPNGTGQPGPDDKLYGYEVQAAAGIEDYEVTRQLPEESGKRVSYLSETKVMVRDSRMLEGKLVLAASPDTSGGAAQGDLLGGAYLYVERDVLTLDGGVYDPAADTGAVTGEVWADDNMDGIHDQKEKGYGGITVVLEQLVYEDGAFAPTGRTWKTRTSSDGIYAFESLASYDHAGKKLYGYRLRVETLPQNHLVTVEANDNYLKKDLTIAQKTDEPLLLLERKGKSTDYELSAFETRGAQSTVSQKAGITRQPQGIISGMVWEDEDRDGLRQDTESPVESAIVMLEYKDKDGSWIQHSETATAEDGSYIFDGLPTSRDGVPMEYRIKMERGMFAFTAKDADNNVSDHIDSDVALNAEGSAGVSDTIVLLKKNAADEYDYLNVRSDHNDIGLILSHTWPHQIIGDRIFLDENENGYMDEGEAPLSGVLAVLYEKQADGRYIEVRDWMGNSRVHSNRDGYYHFYVDATDPATDRLLTYRVVVVNELENRYFTQKPELPYPNNDSIDMHRLNNGRGEEWYDSSMEDHQSIVTAGTLESRYKNVAVSEDIMLGVPSADGTAVADSFYNSMGNDAGLIEIHVPEDPDDPKDPEDPDDPKDPEDPENPKDPEDPKNPENPENPKDPNEPKDPNKPENPNEPKDPNKPENPNDPNGPDSPEDPNGPGGTDNPEDPNGPGGADSPENSNGPDGTDSSEDPNGPDGSGGLTRPKTGDNTAPGVLLAANILSAGILLLALYKWIRKKKEEGK